MKLFLIFLGLITLSTAMIPRQGKVMPDPADIGEESTASRPEASPPNGVVSNSTALLNTTAVGNSTTTSNTKPICAYSTPCAWVIYKPPIKFIEYNLTNSYCVCGPGMECIFTDDDTYSTYYVLHCREPDSLTALANNDQETQS